MIVVSTCNIQHLHKELVWASNATSEKTFTLQN